MLFTSLSRPAPTTRQSFGGPMTTTDTQAHTETIAKITGAFLGWEDHGILTCTLTLDYGGSGQGTPGYGLDEPRQDAAGKHIGRFGTAFGMEFVARLMRACGVNQWDAIKGRTVIAIRDGEGWNGLVRGIKPLPTEQ